jgi:uncharacterized protein YkwD
MLLCATTVLSGFVTAPAARADLDAELHMKRLINRAREDHDRDKLRLSERLSNKARRHSRAMADEGTIFHSDLRKTVEDFVWSLAGENVGMGPSMISLHKAFMNSPPHRENVLDRRFERVGIGVVWRDGTAFITVLFLG